MIIIKYNSKKIFVLICKNKYMKNVVPSLKINGETILEVDDVKYLDYLFLTHYLMTWTFTAMLTTVC